MEGNWSIVLNGEAHAVRAHLPRISLRPQLAVYLDGTLIHKNSVGLYWGELCQIRVLGHQLAIKITGLGALGELGLLIDGIEAAQFSANTAPQPLNNLTETSIAETQRIEESLGEEVREIDNSKSAVEIQRTVRVSRDWTQSYVLEQEISAKAGGELRVQGTWIADLRVSAEGAIRKRYEITATERRTYVEELTIEVPAKTKVQVFLKWKQIWQCGLVVVRNGMSGAEVQVPFRVSIGPTFDQRQIDA